MTNGEIKELREKLGMTTQQFADRVGVRRYTINRWERGITKPHAVFTKILEELKQEAKTTTQTMDKN